MQVEVGKVAVCIVKVVGKTSRGIWFPLESRASMLAVQSVPATMVESQSTVVEVGEAAPRPLDILMLRVSAVASFTVTVTTLPPANPALSASVAEGSPQV